MIHNSQLFPPESPRKKDSTPPALPYFTLLHNDGIDGNDAMVGVDWYGFPTPHATASQKPSMPTPSLDSPAALPPFRSAAIPWESWRLEPRARVRCSMPHHPGK